MCVHVCMYVEVGEYHPWVSSQGHTAFKTRSLRGLDVTTEVRLTGQKALAILSPQLQLCDYKPFLHTCQGPSWLPSKHFTNGTISPA